MKESDLNNINGEWFEFSKFTCKVENGVVYLEQYSEGAYPLENIKTIEDFNTLKFLLTGYEEINNTEDLFCSFCGEKKSYIVSTDINSGKICKNRLCHKCKIE